MLATSGEGFGKISVFQKKVDTVKLSGGSGVANKGLVSQKDPDHVLTDGHLKTQLTWDGVEPRTEPKKTQLAKKILSGQGLTREEQEKLGKKAYKQYLNTLDRTGGGSFNLRESLDQERASFFQ